MITRRSLLAGLVAPLESARYLDPQTEHIVTRLTRPDSAALLPLPGNRFVSPREKALYLASDREGNFAPYRFDLRTGMVNRLAAPSRTLQPRSLSLASNGRALYTLDNGLLQQSTLPGHRQTPVAQRVAAYSAANTVDDFAILRDGRLYHQGSGERVYADGITGDIRAHPAGQGSLFTRDAELWYAPWQAGQPPRRLAAAPVASPCWSPDGTSVLYLRGDTIFELPLAGGVEKAAARTSRFASFAPNADGSVFVGASASKAQPFILLLLRSVQRELALCEHRASDPASVAPSFSPDSRRVYFQSDWQGHPAIFSVNVETLVEPTSW